MLRSAKRRFAMILFDFVDFHVSFLSILIYLFTCLSVYLFMYNL